MPQVVIAVGFDSANNPIDLYTGQDSAAAEAAVDAAGTAGTIIEGCVYRNPPPVVTLRYGPESKVLCLSRSARPAFPLTWTIASVISNAEGMIREDGT